ncbi:hypothetical protein GOBAR_AA20427 [Gossypium barbadense]|uniref:Uncharacterized protein n=1 Tax=Gossypium barbadense TaxID=3634 RepID=A0A2P5XA75_GOSBA|nr:hypothetical protein GOBAR_AA20427 [Gossypium barbadense]
MEAGHVFVEDVKDAIARPPVVDPIYHLDLTELIFEIDDAIAGVYTRERTLRVWENEIPVFPDLSTWEVHPTTFELIPDKGLRRNPKGRPQSSRIHNEIDIREKSDEKLCGVCG